MQAKNFGVYAKTYRKPLKVFFSGGVGRDEVERCGVGGE